ncbi:phage repressor protein [Sphingomonas azotifigens]|uniref:phage repressor protein n=1 Tax=Sphingomonas azotifigens TaxID=330920 RepID=UPI001FE2AD6C|nr:phage repressor protein [Sphingomonas azotifigens]
MLGHQEGYIARFVRSAVPYELSAADRAKAAEYLGVPGPHLGAPARPDDLRAYAERKRYRPEYRTVLRRAT